MMIKYALIASAIGFAFTAPASAETLFDGTLQFTAVTAACTEGPYAGSIDKGRFHPSTVPGNLGFTALNRIWSWGAESWNLEGAGGFTGSFQQVGNQGIGWNAYTPSKPSFVQVTAQAPTTLTATTPSMTLVGKIKNPWGHIGQENCIASFRFIGVLEAQ